MASLDPVFSVSVFLHDLPSHFSTLYVLLWPHCSHPFSCPYAGVTPEFLCLTLISPAGSRVPFLIVSWGHLLRDIASDIPQIKYVQKESFYVFSRTFTTSSSYVPFSVTVISILLVAEPQILVISDYYLSFSHVTFPFAPLLSHSVDDTLCVTYICLFFLSLKQGKGAEEKNCHGV